MSFPRLSRLLRPLATAVLLGTASASWAAEITVSAAASLTNAFKDIAQGYEAHYPSAKIGLNFGASGALLQQMAKGAPVDVFAAADQETMDLAQQQGLVAAPQRHDFVRNALVLIVPADSQLALQQLADLGQPKIKRVAIGNPASVPVGRYTQHALEAAKLWSMLQAKAIHTQNVRQALDYVARGEVDAGFVYATDAALMPGKVRVALEVPLDVVIRYPIAVTVAATAEPAKGAEARRFVAYLDSPAAQAILRQYGFRRP